jgi:hypothetical protein
MTSGSGSCGGWRRSGPKRFDAQTNLGRPAMTRFDGAPCRVHAGNNCVERTELPGCEIVPHFCIIPDLPGTAGVLRAPSGCIIAALFMESPHYSELDRVAGRCAGRWSCKANASRAGMCAMAGSGGLRNRRADTSACVRVWGGVEGDRRKVAPYGAWAEIVVRSLLPSVGKACPARPHTPVPAGMRAG